MINTKKLTSLLGEAITDYRANISGLNSADWLEDYLGRKLPSKTGEEIHEMSEEIFSTLDIMEKNDALMQAALDNGQSAESWLTSEIANESGSSGEKAKTAAELYNGIAAAEAD